MKQVIVVNESLKLPRGKLAAQVAHAAVGAFLVALPKARDAWLNLGMPKIVLQGRSEEEVVLLAERAKRAGLPVALIQDAGKTIVATGTVTCVGIGPADAQEIDHFTGGMPLVK